MHLSFEDIGIFLLSDSLNSKTFVLYNTSLITLKTFEKQSFFLFFNKSKWDNIEENDGK